MTVPRTPIQAASPRQGDGGPHPFSHTRLYPVDAGVNTFYAVAHNYVGTAGTGRASVYATLTATYYPNRY